MTWVLFAVAAMTGGTIRVIAVERLGPRGTTLVNLVGSFMLGMVIATGADSDTTRILATGFCGSLTTLSGLVADSVGGGTPVAYTRRLTLETAAGVAAAALGYLLAG